MKVTKAAVCGRGVVDKIIGILLAALLPLLQSLLDSLLKQKTSLSSKNLKQLEKITDLFRQTTEAASVVRGLPEGR